MGKGSGNRTKDHKRYGENFDCIDWGETRSIEDVGNDLFCKTCEYLCEDVQSGFPNCYKEKNEIST